MTEWATTQLSGTPADPHQKMLNWLGSVSNDPYAFVLGAFPWGEPGELERFSGPDVWQREVLDMIRDGLPTGEAIRIAVASGRGIGKTALITWIIIWAMATMPHTKGKVAANTEPQLRTVNWPELGKWYNLFLGRELFKLTATSLFAIGHEQTWRFDQATWSKENSDAFRGMHNKGRRMIVLFDEASGIPDNIWEVTEGSLTDSETQMIWCAFSNPSKSTGRFRECFPGQRHARYWKTKQIDSRTVAITDKTLFARWIDTYGEDNDFVRIHVRGVFPRVGEMEFIPESDVAMAADREVLVRPHEPLVIGVDVARYGSNESVIFFRKGRDGRTIAPIRLRGVSTVDLAAKVSEVYHQYSVDAIFVDGGGVGGGVVDNLRALHIFCFDINFGSKAEGIGWTTGSDGERYANKRAEMWGNMRAWLRSGSIPSDADLHAQLVSPLYTYNLQNQIQLEKKEDMAKRGRASPDIADALALTFAYPVSAHANAGGDFPRKPVVESEYDPYSAERMVA